MIKKIAPFALLILLLAVAPVPVLAQGPVGGATAPPKFPDTTYSELLSDPGFELDTIGSAPANGWVGVNTCVLTSGTNDSAVSGSGSTKSAAANTCTSGATLLEQTVTVGAHEAIKLSGWAHYTVDPSQILTTTAASLTSNVVTLTFSSVPAAWVSHGTIQVAGFTGADTYFNGTYNINAVTATTVAYEDFHANGTATTTGTVTPAVTLAFTIFDITHGTASAQFSAGRTSPQEPIWNGTPAGEVVITPSQSTTTDWAQIGTEFFVSDAHYGDSLQVRYVLTGILPGTSTLYLDDLSLKNETYPVRNFLLSPNFRGYVWKDIAPVSRTLLGTTYCGSPAVGTVCGVLELDSPSLASDTATVTIQTNSDCQSGTVLATETVVGPSAKQPYSFPPSSYAPGGLPAAGTTIGYVCSKLNVTTGGALIDNGDTTWKLVAEDATFRNALQNYVAPDGSIYHNGVQTFENITYDRCATERCFGGTGGGIFSTPGSCGRSDSAVNCYLYDLSGNVSSGLVAPASALVPSKSTMYADYSAAKFNCILNFVNWSAINPTGSPNQLSPLLQALQTYSLCELQITNNWFGHAWGETNVPGAPSAATLSCVSSCNGGSITASTLHVQITGVQWALPGGSSNGLGSTEGVETIPSSDATLALSSQGCAGVNCTATVTLPACTTLRQAGYFLYTSTNGVTYSRQYPSSTGFVQSSPLACGSTVTLSSLMTNTNTPPGNSMDFTNNRPSWVGGTIDPTSWVDISAVQNATFPAGLAFYQADEPRPTSINTVFYQQQTLEPNANGILTACVIINGTALQLWRDVCDIVGNDPYGYGGSSNNDDFSVDSVHANGTCTVYSGPFNATSAQKCNPQRMIGLSRQPGNATYGYRPIWEVYQNFSLGNFLAAPYAELRRQQLAGLIGCMDWGSSGCGLAMWMEGYSTGVEQRVYVDSSTQVQVDVYQVNSDMLPLRRIAMLPNKDSSAMGLGNIVTAVSSGTSITTDCGASSIFQNATLYPLKQVRLVTKLDPTNGDEYIFVDHGCGGSDTVTITLGSIPAGQSNAVVYGEGRIISLSSNQFVDTMGPYQASVYVIRTPRGVVIGAQPN